MKAMKLLVMAAALVSSVGFASVANAAPLAPSPIEVVAGESQAMAVAYGCGPGYTRGPYGGCRPIVGVYGYRGGGYYGGRVYGGRRIYAGRVYGGRAYRGGRVYGGRAYRGGRVYGGRGRR